MSQPIAYRHAHLGVEGRAMLAMASDLWSRLSRAQQSTMRRCVGGVWPRLPVNTHARVAANLRARGLVESGGRDLTIIGALVREVGMHETVAGRRAA